MIHEQHYQIPLLTFSFTHSFINDKVSYDNGKKKPAATAVRDEPVWIPPPQGMIKINVDVVVSKSTGRGAVARSDANVFAGASVVAFLGKTEAETLEALACREAIVLAYDINARQGC